MRLGAIGNGLTGITRRRPACPLLGPLALLLAALACAAPAPAQTTVKLVSNNLQRDADFGRSFGKDLWQPFTTGSSPTGYKLTGVDIALSQVTGNPAYTLSIETHSRGRTVYDFPGTHFATLDNPPGSLVAGLNRHTATGQGIDLAPNTTYRLFLDVTTPAAGHVVKVTSSDAEDAGGLPEWSIAYRAGYRNWWSSENRGGNTWPLKIALHGYVQTLPGKPTSVAATASATSGALSVSWSKPADLGTGTPKGYEVRYYAGSQDPTDEADWVEDRAGLPDIGPGQLSATVGGLLADTTYRVQVRAVTGAGGGEWSDSASATTGSPPSTNNAPRLLYDNTVWPEGNICSIRDPSEIVWAYHFWVFGDDSPGTVTDFTRKLTGRRGETSEWPSVCSTEVWPHFAPVFDDVDGDKLTLFIEPKPAPAIVRMDAMWVTQQTSSENARVFFRGASALRWAKLSVDVTATDPHGASVTARVAFRVRTFTDTATPRFTATVPDQDGSAGEPFSLVLPEATGGDIVSGDLTFPYYYAVSGLPPGLLFDSATRTISGAPTAGGSFTVTYTADDADGYASGFLYPVIVDKTDRASETFKIKIPCDSGVPCHSPPAVEQPPAARSSAPSFGGAAVAAVKIDRGRAMTPVVLPRATGGDGALAYSLTSSPAGLAGLDFDPATRRLSGTPGSPGSWTFTYRAEDADADRTDSDAAVLTFEVTVTVTGEAKAAVKRTLSGVAVRTLSSALGHIGVRLANVVPAGGLTLAGRRLEFAAPGVGVEGAGSACAWGGSDRDGFGRHGLDGQRFDGHGLDGQGFDGNGFDGYGVGDARQDGLGPGGGCEGWSRGIGTEELLRASAFSWLLGAAEGSGGADPAAARWAVWGRGDFSDFAGRPEGMSYDGKARSGWLGVDARKGRWVAGLALSHGVSEADYSYGGGAERGWLETTLTALYPYGRWTLAEGLEVRGVLGAGSGEARHMPEGAEAATSDLTMRMGSAGVRRELAEVLGIELAARADASLVRMEIGAGPEFIDGVSADSWRARVGLEATRRLALGEETALTPFMEVAGRRDGGDGLEGSGLEVAGGVRYTAPRVEVEARGRLLAAHAEEGARERGVSVTARLGPGADGRGLSLSLRPRWGAGTGGAEALWRDELPGLSGDEDEAALDARIGYGVAVAPVGGLLTPFVEAGMSKGRRLRVGTRFDGWRADLGMELSGERREGDNGEVEHGVLLDLRLRF